MIAQATPSSQNGASEFFKAAGDTQQLPHVSSDDAYDFSEHVPHRPFPSHRRPLFNSQRVRLSVFFSRSPSRVALGEDLGNTLRGVTS